MAILQVSYNCKTKVATLHPIGSASPAGSELVGTTGTGVTFYHAVQALLRGIGIHSMGPVSIVFASELTPVVEVKAVEPEIVQPYEDEQEEEEEEEPVVQEPVVKETDPEPAEESKKTELF